MGTAISEKTTERKIKADAEKRGGVAIKLLAVAGLPDRMVLLPGGIVMFAELKTTGQKPTKLQLYWIAFLRRLGFYCEVIDTQEAYFAFWRWADARLR